MFKYEIGKTVVYRDFLGQRRIGKIKDRIKNYNDTRNIYFITGCQYAKDESEIICEANIPYKEKELIAV